MKIRFKPEEIDEIFAKNDQKLIYYFFKIVYLLEKSSHKIIKYSDISEDESVLSEIISQLSSYFEFKDSVTYKEEIKKKYEKLIEDRKKAGKASGESRKKINKAKKKIDLFIEEADRTANYWEFGRDVDGTTKCGEYVIFENQRFFVPAGELIYDYIKKNYLKN